MGKKTRNQNVKTKIDSSMFGTESIGKILLHTAPPVMLAQLIQALYNIVDSYFVGKFSANGLTALSVIFPVQLVITALAIGIGVGVNTLMARQYAQNESEAADKTAGTGLVLTVACWALFTLLAMALLRPYASMSAQSPEAVEFAVLYGRICCVGSLGIFMESVFTKVHQANGNMALPMAAQIAGALTNIALDPLLIFGMFGLPEMGIAGAATATVCGQFVAMFITGARGFRRPPKRKEMPKIAGRVISLGCPYTIMNTMCTVYIVALNVILAGFGDAAVTVLGLYYKMQAFFFIPLLSLSTCIIPVLSYNYARGSYRRCRAVMRDSVILSLAFMLVGVFCFEALPSQVISIFSREAEVFAVGIPAFRIIGLSFFSAVFSLITPVFFQAIGAAKVSVAISVMREIICLIPIFWLLSRLGLGWTWWAFPLSETISGGFGLVLYLRQIHRWPDV